MRSGLAFLLLLAGCGLLGLGLWFRHHLVRARQAVEAGHNRVARNHLKQCDRLAPDRADVLLLHARVERRSGNTQTAEDYLDRCSRLHGDDDASVFERLMLKAAQGRIEEAGPLLAERAERSAADARLVREALISGLIVRFRQVDAELALANWLSIEPDDTTALLLRGKLAEQRSQVDPAIEYFSRVVALDPEHDEARLRLTTMLVHARRTEDLMRHLEFLRPRLPDVATVHVQWAKALALAGRPEDALAAIDDCLARFPDFPAALAERGALAVQAGDDRTAEECLGRAAKLDPGDLTARAQYAVVLARNGKTAEADREKETLNQLTADQDRLAELIAGPLQTRPRDPSVPHEIAMIAMRSGQPDEAYRWLQSALLIDPNHGPSHQVLANYHQAAGNPALAAKHRALAKQFMKKP